MNQAVVGVASPERVVAFARHVPVFPCGRDKRPLVKGGFHAASQDAAQIRQWWNDHPDALVGVPTGQTTGLVAIDYDPHNARRPASEWIEAHAELLAITRTHHTASGGHHWLYRTTDRYQTGTNLQLERIVRRGIDLRANGAYVIWWPLHGLGVVNDEALPLPAGLIDERKAPAATLTQPSSLPAPKAWGEERDRIGDALGFLKPDGYDHWIRIGMAIHEAAGGSEDGFRLWHQWSQEGETYDGEADCRYHWNSFGDFDGRRTMLGTLYYEAWQAGWRGFTPQIFSLIKSREASSGNEDAPGETGEERPALIETAFAAASDAATSEWLLRPYLERDVLALMYGDYGTLKSFKLIDWSLRIALGMPAIGYEYKREPQDVVYISAEGKGLWKRLRAWCLQHRKGEDWEDVLREARLWVIRRPVNLSDSRNIEYFASEIDKLGIQPALIGVDTLSRNSDGEPEKSTDAATRYLNQLDQGLRTRYKATVCFVHHVGHGDKGRHRGPIVLAANTDAEFRITRPDPDQLAVTLECVRLKDSEPPEPMGFEAHVHELGGFDEDGKAISSLAFTRMDGLPRGSQKAPSGRAQEALLKALQALQQEADAPLIWTAGELRAVGRGLGQQKTTARRAAEGLLMNGFLVAAVGGNRLSDDWK